MLTAMMKTERFITQKGIEPEYRTKRFLCSVIHLFDLQTKIWVNLWVLTT